MWGKKIRKFAIVIFLCALFSEIWILKIVSDSQMGRLSVETIQTQGYRDQEIGEELFSYIKEKSSPSLDVALYLLESNFGYQPFSHAYKE